jgi:predicted acylesterase/phospholipase RssA
MKAIVIQGGGSFGAFTAGRINAKPNVEYQVAVGSSTGALIAPFALLRDSETLKRCYTGISNKDIYSRYPFYDGGIPKVPLAIWRYMRGKTGITDSQPLRRLIKKEFTEVDYNEILSTGKRLFVTVCALNKKTDKAMYIEMADCKYEEFCDYLWASTLVPALLESHIVEHEGFHMELVDGGTVENVGLKKVLEIGCSEVDIYLHESFESGYKALGKNWIQNLIRTLQAQRQEVIDSDLSISKEGVKINKFYLPYKLKGTGIMDFNKEAMANWYNEGYNIGKLENL